MKQKPNEKNTPGYFRAQIAGGRYALLVVIILTLINLAAVIAGSGRYFLFSATIPYYLTLFAKGMDNNFSFDSWNIVGSYTRIALVVSVAVLCVYFLCWLISRKRPGWMAVALGLFALDSAALLFVASLLYGNPLAVPLDVFLHGWALWQLFQAVRGNKKLKESPQTL